MTANRSSTALSGQFLKWELTGVASYGRPSRLQLPTSSPPPLMLISYSVGFPCSRQRLLSYPYFVSFRCCLCSSFFLPSAFSFAFLDVVSRLSCVENWPTKLSTVDQAASGCRSPLDVVAVCHQLARIRLPPASELAFHRLLLILALVTGHARAKLMFPMLKNASKRVLLWKPSSLLFFPLSRV